MTSLPTYTSYACHRLIDECGFLHSASVVRIDKLTHCVVGFTPFDYTESPFIQWVGGTIVLADTHQSPFLSGFTLSQYIQQVSVSPLPPDSKLIAWYTPLTDIHTPLPTPITKLISEAFIHTM